MATGLLRAVGRRLAQYLNTPRPGYHRFATSEPEKLLQVLLPADILLVEGDTRFSSAIKYLTQSTWSHVALYIGDALKDHDGQPVPALLEADIERGVIAIPVDTYAEFNVRICRPHELTSEDAQKVIDYVVKRLGLTYDLKNIFDLARYLIPTPPIPGPWRRQALAFGSGDPTKAICSSLIAEAFQSVRFPILPHVNGRILRPDGTTESELLSSQHPTMFMPRDFDLSPYFKTVKPTVALGFNYKTFQWSTTENTHAPS